jgi:hypothetical protein
MEKQKLIDLHQNSDELYCCYCLEPKGDKWHCCQENHFMTFSDFGKQEQDEFIEWELKESEELAAKQGALV